MAFGFRVASVLSLGIIKAPITKDQIANLQGDNVVAEDAKSLDDLGIRPTAMEAVLPDYLWRFRPSGQYDAIKESAKNLRNS
jgi:NADH dehydrogenase